MRHKPLVVFAVAFAGGFGIGCAVKSPPNQAEIQQQALENLRLPPDWRTGGGTGPVADNWLASFQDAQLEDLVAEAIRNSPDIRVAATRVEQAAAYVELARAALRPSVGLLGTGGIKAGGGGDLSGALQGVMLGVSWEPDIWGRLRYARNATQEIFAASQADYCFALESLAASTAKTWFTASETWLQKEIADGMVESSRELVRLAEKRQQVGQGDDRDVALARGNLAVLQDSALQLRQAHEQTLRALELLLGRYPSAELEARHDLGSLPGPVPTGMPLQMLERRPDLIAAERRVAAAFNLVGEAKAARLPRLVLNASVGALSSDVLALKPGFENPTAGVGGRVVAPIYTGGALSTQIVIRSLQQKEAVATYARMALRALGDVENALAGGRTLAEREPLLRVAVAENERALELEQVRYRVGRTDLRSVLQQQISLGASRSAMLRAQSDQLAQRVNLHLALGGSFERPPNPGTAAPAGPAGAASASASASGSPGGPSPQ